MKGLAIYAAVLVASLALFWLAPGIDLFVSRLFYDPQHGFTLAAWPPLREFTASIRWITGAILLVAAVVLSSCLKEVPLRLVSGNQARAQASAPEGAGAEVVAAAESVDVVRASATGDTADGG